MLTLEMRLTTLPQTPASREACEAWRAAAHVVSVRWQVFLDAGSETRRLAFASYLAALDAEEASRGGRGCACRMRSRCRPSSNPRNQPCRMTSNWGTDERPLTAPAHEGMADEHDHGWAVDDR